MSLEKKLRSLKSITFLARLITRSKVPEAEASVRILIEHGALLAERQKARRIEKMLRQCNVEALAAYYATKLLNARRFHYPIQYLIGEWAFKDLVLKVKPPILIPRFETEYLVGEAISEIKKKWKKGSAIKFVDLGCGTGAIGLSLMKQLENEYQISGTLVDISTKCINLAKFNAIKNNISHQKLSFVCDDMKNCSALLQESQVIISNPPYLTQNSHKKLQKQVKIYEEYSALVGGQDGLDYVRFLIEEVTKMKKQGRDLLCFIQYGGQNLQHLGAQQYVRRDQYDKRRYIIIS